MTIKSSIAETKDNLPKYIHKAEAGHDICITRHGKAVAMLVSIDRYKDNFATEDQTVYSAIMAWRKQLEAQNNQQWAAIDTLRDKTPARDFSWD